MHIRNPDVDIEFVKCVDKTIAHSNECLTYEIRFCNNSSYLISSICIKDCIQDGIDIIPASLYVSKKYEGTLETGIFIMETIGKCEEIKIQFSAIINEHSCKEIRNQASLEYEVNKEIYSCESNVVCTRIFEQHLNELYTSIAYVEAALASITNVEGAKIQKMVCMQNVTTEELMCLNKSVQEVLEIITMFEIVLKRKATLAKCIEVKNCE